MNDAHCVDLRQVYKSPETVPRGSIFTVLVLPLLSWSCASALKTKTVQDTPVEKRQQPTDSPETQLEKHLTMIKDFQL